MSRQVFGSVQAASNSLAGFRLIQISFGTVDKRKCQLNGEVSIRPVATHMHLVFVKRTKVVCITQGDPLEFKRLYKALLVQVSDIVAT
jgi:hypothetical protein